MKPGGQIIVSDLQDGVTLSWNILLFVPLSPPPASTPRLCALLRGQVLSPGDGWMHRQMVCSRLEVFPQTDALFQENNVISG